MVDYNLDVSEIMVDYNLDVGGNMVLLQFGCQLEYGSITIWMSVGIWLNFTCEILICKDFFYNWISPTTVL